nr:MAG TPA: hypothetical protein [Caudoviricetes sp.]
MPQFFISYLILFSYCATIKISIFILSITKSSLITL